MSPESSGPAGLGETRSPGRDGWLSGAAGGPDADWPGGAAGGPDADWPPDDASDERDPDWPDDWPDEDQADPPWRRAMPPGATARTAAAYGPGGGPRRRNLRPLALTAVAVVALGAGAGVALAIGRGLDSSSSPSATPSTQPSYAAPGSGSGTAPGGGVPGGGGAGVETFVEGRVSAVSSTSITIGGPGQSLTAAVTAATKVTGKVASIGGVKVGDQVSAQITTSGGQPTVTALQDPAQAPPGGVGPP
jgi:hypothetical protein